MTIEEALIYGKKNIHSDHAKILLAEIIGLNPLELLANLERLLTKQQIDTYRNAIQAIKNGTPLQYALGKINFYGIEYTINKNVLIPRFETEELVENTIQYIKKYFTEPVDIIDLGCGSGIIGLTLEQKISTKTVDLVDISEKALEVAHQNCVKQNSKAKLIQSDMFSNVEKKYDVIISNPPYIRTDEEIEEIVKNNEPPIALYGGEDGLDCYRKILTNIKPRMKEKCLIAFEIGMLQKEAMIDLIHTYLGNVDIECKKDLSGRDRMIFIKVGMI